MQYVFFALIAHGADAVIDHLRALGTHYHHPPQTAHEFCKQEEGISVELIILHIAQQIYFIPS